MGIDQMKRKLTDFIKHSDNEEELLTGVKKLISSYEQSTSDIIEKRRKGMRFPDLSAHPNIKQGFDLADYPARGPLIENFTEKFFEETKDLKWDTTVEEDAAMLKSLG
ncbi:hypothetical protein [Neolewinella antarctica]|uniref:Uncharacterized protein n=1 Tax=Neolewinella antarctica TaxID=442734 RepID=A0ABX0XEL4_9BACT|nr:hypothetical protein [Neolewinella antarctica]NJC27657.1 hypothetical protein [Neolewinella antarctica]